MGLPVTGECVSFSVGKNLLFCADENEIQNQALLFTSGVLIREYLY
jgi:hypothetical protein